MKRFFSRPSAVAAAISVSFASLYASPAFAAKAAAELGDGIDITAAGAGTFTGFAYAMRTILNGAAAVAPANQSSSFYTSPIASGGVTLLNPVPLAVAPPPGGPVFLNFGGGWFGGAVRSYGPSVSAGRAKNLLTAPLESETVASDSGGIGTSVHALASYELKGTFWGNPSVDAYSYSDAKVVQGNAAAIAYDPYTLPTGEYDLGDGNDLIDLDLQMDHPNQIGDVQFSAFDSRYTGDLAGDDIIYGAPLWSLLVTSYGVAKSDKSNVEVQFALNPNAVEAGDFVYDGTALTLMNYELFDATLAADLKTELTVAGGEITLDDGDGYDPFPSNFDYLVTGGSITYASDAGAGFMSAPEPTTWTMLHAGFCGLGFAGYWPRKNARRIPSSA